MKSKAHQRYKLANGEIVPGVTTITGQLSKPALIIWANKLGLQGIDSTKFRDDKADIGTLAHEMIKAHLSKREIDKKLLADYSKNQIDQADNSCLSYYAWEKQHKIEPIFTEYQGVSEEYKYGGSFDFYGIVDGSYELIDFKTGSGIYDEMWFQLAGYGGLINAQNIIIDRYRILNIPRTEDESFKEEVKTDLSLHFEAFLKLLDFYYLNKQINRK